LRAAEKFEKAHLSTPEVARLIDGAKYFYVEGYFLTHGVESALEVARKASDGGKVRFHPFETAFCLNTVLTLSQGVCYQPFCPFHHAVLQGPT
jgi:hypothetical protein